MTEKWVLNVRSEGKVSTRQGLFQGVFGMLGDGIIMTDLEGCILYSNEAAGEILEWPGSPQPGTPFQSCCQLLDVQTGLPYESPVKKALNTGKSVGLHQNVGILGTQGPIYLSMTCAPIRNRHGRISGCFAIVRDVTQLRALEMKIEDDQRYMRSVFSAATVGFCLLNIRGEIVDINEAALETMHAKSDEIIGRQFGDAFCCVNSTVYGCGHGEMCRQCPARHNIEMAIGDDSYASEFELVMHSDRAKHAVWLKIFVSQMGVGEDKQIILAILNESARRQYEQQLETAKQAAEEASRTKMRFISNMSHELRTPINGVLGMIDLAMRQPLTPKLENYLRNAKQGSQDLLRLINDILDFSKLDSGRMKLESINFDLKLMLEQIEDTYKTLARSQGTRLVTPDITELPQFVRGDPLRIRQIFSNLLNNALKFTSEGCIEIEAAVGRRKGRASLEFAVRDSGIGMSEAEMKRIFKPFAQADASTTRKYGGTGLGLMIVKDLLVNMGGDIEVESQPGKGSRFAFWMPLVEAQEAEPEIRQNTAFVNPKMGKVKVSEAEENWLKEAMGEVASPVPGATDDISDLLAYAAKKLKGDGA